MTMTTDRRNVLKAASAAAVSTAVLPETQAFAQGNLQAAAKAMPYQAKPMPFDPEAIARDFGSLERWRAQFAAMGKAEGGGSGWVILAYSPRDKRLVNQWAADHTTTLAGGRPVLVLDMYEHAYHMDYGAAAARYVDVYMEAIRWDNAAKLYEQYSREG